MAGENRKLGVVRVDGDLPQMTQIDRDPGISSAAAAIGGVGQAAEQTFAGLAGNMREISTRVGALADHAAAVEGREAGHLAGLDPEFRPTKSMTIRGEAYDKAGLDVMLSKTKVEMAADLEAAYDKHGADPQGLAKALAHKRSAWIGKLPQELRPDITIDFERHQLHYMRAAGRAQMARFQAEQKAAAVDELADGFKRLHQQAYAMGLDPNSDAALATGVADLQKLLSRKDATGKPLFDPVQARRMIKDASEDVTQSRLLGAFERTPTIEGKQAILDKFREEYAAGTGAGGQFNFDKFRTVEKMLESEVRQARAGQGIVAKQVKADIGEFTRMAAKGEALSPDGLAALRTRVASQAPELAGDLARAENVLSFVTSLRDLPPDRHEALVMAERARLTATGGQLKRDGEYNSEWARLDLAEQQLAEKKAAIKDDPVAWGAKAGFKITPINLSSPAAMQATLKARVAEAQQLAEANGHPVDYLTKAEGARLAAMAAEGGDQLLTVAGVVAGAGEAAPKIMSELGKHGPAVAFVGSMALQPGLDKAARDAADGLGLMRLDGFKTRVSPAKARAAFDEEIGAVLNALPGNKQALEVVASAIYEKRADRLGKAAADFDADLYKQAVREALGEHKVGGVTYGGFGYQKPGTFWGGSDRVVVPPFIAQKGFREVIDSIKLTDLIDPMGNRPVDAKGRDITEASIRRARTVPVGSGRYILALGDDPDDPQYVGGGNGPGGAYVLDLNKLRPILAKRRPDLVLGGR